MVHRMRKLGTTWRFNAVLAGLFILVSGCSRPNPNPENIDPIYTDLIQRSALAKAAAETAKSEKEKLRSELENLPARDVARRKTLADISKQESRAMVAEQEGLYYEVRAEQRKAYARAEYLKAFEKGEPWPNPKDFETYKIQRKLQESPKEWSSKVRKTDRYNRKTPEDMRKELEEQLKGSGAGGH